MMCPQYIAHSTQYHTICIQDAAKANMAIVQSKLQACINTGQMNSFDRLSNLFSGNDNNNNDDNNDMDNSDVEMSNTALIKDKDNTHKQKIKKSTIKNKVGQYGNKTTRKVKESTYRRTRTSTKYGGDSSKRGKGNTKKIEGRKSRSSSKKSGGSRGGGKKMATI